MGFQPPFLRHPPLDPACTPFFKIFVSLTLFSVPPPFKVFQTVIPTLTQLPPALIQHTNLPYTITRFKQLSKGWFYQFNCRFLSKINFYFLNPFTNISGYLNLWDIFRFIFRQLRMNFFHKIMVAEEIIFLQMNNTVLQIVK